MIDGVTNADALPVLEQMFRFAGQRHRLLLHNIANADTPYFRPVDVSVDGFREKLAEAADARRERFGAGGGPLEFAGSEDVAVTAQGLRFDPAPIGENILFHDQNDRDLERMMQGLAENFMVFRAAADLMKSRVSLLTSAIQERP